MKKLKKMWLYLIILTICILIVSPYIFQLWLGESIKIPFILSVAMTTYVIAYTWQTLHIYLLNGIGKVRLQLYLVVFCSIVNIPLSFFLGKKIGLSGIIFSNSIIFIFMGIIFSIQCNKILNNTAKGLWIK
jgi:O-antigen/teichoic acid export membrane protein